MIKKQIETSAEILECISKRWSGVAFDPDRPVTKQQLSALLEAARWAPSCFGDQPWRYIVCDKTENPEAWQKLYDCLMEGNQAWCKHVPILIAACHDTVFNMNGQPNGLAAYDTGAASVSLCLQATELGLMSHQMAGFSAELVSEKFQVPERFKPIATIAIGYQLPEDKIPAELKERELAPRKRNPLSKNFFMGSWGGDS